MTSTETIPGFEPASTERPVWPALRRGWTRRCPNCGKGHAFQGYLTLSDRCPECGEDFSHARTDDGPAYLTILIVAKLLGPMMLWVYTTWQPGPYALSAMFSIGALALALYLLPRLKGSLLGFQWAKRMHGF